MTNNDILRHLRYALDIDDSKLVEVFTLAKQSTTFSQISAWLNAHGDAAYEECTDIEFSAFLDGLIIDRRGRKEGDRAVPERPLNNNLIFTKLKIALDLKADDVLEFLKLAGLHIKNANSAHFSEGRITNTIENVVTPCCSAF